MLAKSPLRNMKSPQDM